MDMFFTDDTIDNFYMNVCMSAGIDWMSKMLSGDNEKEGSYKLDVGIFFKTIPRKKINNISTSLELHSDETIYFLVDYTPFGSAKEGLILSSWGIRCIGDEGKWGIPWEMFLEYGWTVNNKSIIMENIIDNNITIKKDFPDIHNMCIKADVLTQVLSDFEYATEIGTQRSDKRFANIDKKLSAIEAHETIDKSTIAANRRVIVVTPDVSSYVEGNFPQFTLSKANELFKFPPHHPVIETAYAMIDMFPDTYVQVSDFHNYLRQIKHASFVELCASLGAKEISIESVEINNQALDINGDLKTPISKLGLGINIHEDKQTGEKLAFSFSEKNSEIKDYESPWLETEPTWKSMNDMRRKYHLKEYNAEFICTDDMGINGSVAAKISGIGIKIGGSFTEMTKVKLAYHVTFW
jgi:hypothetical protein